MRSQALGGIARQYLNHWHESLFGGLPGSGIDAPLFVHRDDARRTRSGSMCAARSRGATTSAPDLEVIPTPGHTPGATAYLWDTGEHRLLFTGDTLYLRDGEWRAAVLDSSDRASYIESLELMRGLEFDVLVPWAASAGQAPYMMLDEGEGASGSARSSTASVPARTASPTASGSPPRSVRRPRRPTSRPPRSPRPRRPRARR